MVTMADKRVEVEVINSWFIWSDAWGFPPDNSVNFYHSIFLILFSHTKLAFCACVLGN